MTLAPQTQTLTKKKKNMREWMLSMTTRVSLLGAIVLFGLLYVLQTSVLTTKGFEMSDLEKDIAGLKHENRQLQVQIAKYRSMQSIEARLQTMDMVPAQSVAYLAPLDTTVARR